MKDSTRLTRANKDNELLKVRLTDGRIVEVARNIIEGTWGLEGQTIRRFKCLSLTEHILRTDAGWKVNHLTGRWASPAKQERDAKAAKP